MDDFRKKFVTANTKADSPLYDPAFIAEIRRELVSAAPELEPITEALICSIAIGAHRGDIVPDIFEESLSRCFEEDEKERTINVFRSVIMVVWPFVGLPWCVPAMMGIANHLRAAKLESYACKSFMQPINPGNNSKAGKELGVKTYRGVGNAEVRELSDKYLPDHAALFSTIIFGYCMAGTTATGIFKEEHTELIVAAAIASQGAARQARSHAKASISMDNRVDAVKVLLKMVERFNTWNRTPTVAIDVDSLALELESALGEQLI